MIVQRRETETRLIAQNDHALLSGEFARRLTASVPLDVIIAIALHDCSWLEPDDSPLFDANTGLPYDFQSLPALSKASLYRAGIDRLMVTHPYAALLVSIHYESFVPRREHRGFHLHEQTRQEKLRQDVSHLYSAKAIEQHYELLRQLDLLSLRVCMTAPGVRPEDWPKWILAPLRLDAMELKMRWTSDAEFEIEPFPFEREFEVGIPYRSVGHRYDSEATWRAAWEGTRLQSWRVRIRAGSSGSG